MSAFLAQLSSFVWGLPLMILLVGTGFYLSIRLFFIQARALKHAFHILSGKYDNKSDPGEISHFSALSTALSATIGTGNIVGVAAAILAGGPGAVFWMWLTACIGMATKFTSCTLAVHFRKVDGEGETHAGPMHFIELGMGKKWKWLAVLFAVFTALASFGIGNMFQVNNIVSAVNGLIHGQVQEVLSSTRWMVGGMVAVLVALVILGGIKRIAQCASVLVPMMCAFYILTGVIILIKNAELIIPGFQTIFYYAFHTPEALGGGLLGTVVRAGVARGLFSNEAGLGSAAMAHGAAKTKEPVREGLVAMLGPLIDTLIVCTITALVIVCTGSHEMVSDKGQLTSFAFNQGLPGAGWLVNVGVVLFAFSTLVAWSYYGDRAVDYLFGKGAVKSYRWVYIFFIMLGALRPLDDVINFCDALNGLMAIPNLIALICLAPIVLSLTQDYMKREA
jgi:AGCS family alanine or glycine:cation symporter